MDCCSFELLDVGFEVFAVTLVAGGFVFESDVVCGLLLLAAVGFVVLVFEGVVFDTVLGFAAVFGVALASLPVSLLVETTAGDAVGVVATAGFFSIDLVCSTALGVVHGVVVAVVVVEADVSFLTTLGC